MMRVGWHAAPICAVWRWTKFTRSRALRQSLSLHDEGDEDFIRATWVNSAMALRPVALRRGSEAR
jgi:hypothetical protein